MAHTVTYVQMTDREQLNPSAPVPGLRLQALDPASPLIPELLSHIGTPITGAASRPTSPASATTRDHAAP